MLGVSIFGLEEFGVPACAIRFHGHKVATRWVNQVNSRDWLRLVVKAVAVPVLVRDPIPRCCFPYEQVEIWRHLEESATRRTVDWRTSPK